MSQSIYSRSQSILQNFSNATEGNMLVLYEPGSVTPWDVVPTTRYYGFILDLKAMVDVTSIEETAIPELDPTASRTERFLAIRNMEWNSPRKELELFMRTSTQPISKIGAVSLLNRRPFYQVNLLPFFSDNGVINVGNDAQILARIRDVGYGLLANNDQVTVFGSVKEEVTTLPESASEVQFCQPYSFNVTMQSNQLLAANPNRIQLTITNMGTNNVFLNYGLIAENGKGIALVAGGGSYEINSANPYKGAISAIGAGNSTLSLIECV